MAGNYENGFELTIFENSLQISISLNSYASETSINSNSLVFQNLTRFLTGI